MGLLDSAGFAPKTAQPEWYPAPRMHSDAGLQKQDERGTRESAFKEHEQGFASNAREQHVAVGGRVAHSSSQQQRNKFKIPHERIKDTNIKAAATVARRTNPKNI